MNTQTNIAGTGLRRVIAAVAVLAAALLMTTAW